MGYLRARGKVFLFLVIADSVVRNNVDTAGGLL